MPKIEQNIDFATSSCQSQEEDSQILSKSIVSVYYSTDKIRMMDRDKMQVLRNLKIMNYKNK